MKEYICYIDESGDEGFSQSSSKMFGFSAVLVSKENDILLPKIQKEILLHISQNKNNPLKEIHLHTLKHEQRKYICNAIWEKKSTNSFNYCFNR